MDSLKDLIFRYCVLFGRRFFYKEKIAFLRIISKELMQLGYHVDAKIAKLKLAKKKYESYYNAYIGDLNKADIIVCTYYDTGVNYFNLSKTYAFEQNFNRSRYFLGLLPVFILLVIAVLLNFFIFIPNIQEVGFFSFSGVLLVVSTLLLSYFIIKFKNGIANKKNFVYNTSSILVMLNMINKFDKKMKKKVAFVLYDGGCTNQYGIKMLESYSNKMANKKFIFLDSLGNDDNLVYFKSTYLNCDLEGITFNDSQLTTTLKKHISISSGQLDNNNRIEIKNANSRRDKVLPVSRIEQHSMSLYSLLTQLITNDKDD